LRFRRNLYVLITAVVVFTLFVGSLAWGLGSGVGAGWCLIASACCVLGAVGVAWLGWYWLKLTGAAKFMVKQLRTKSPAHIGQMSNTVISELAQAVNSYFDSNADYTEQLEKQIKDLQIQIRLSQRQKRSTDAIIYSICDAVIVIDEFDKLLMANEAAGGLFNFDFKDSQHKPIGELIDESKDEFVSFLCRCRQSRAGATRQEIEFPEDGEVRTFDCIVSCVYEQERVCGVVAVLHDITHDKKVSQMKNDFVSHVSHELKTPLASITAYTEMLSDGEVADEQTRKRFYSVIQNQAKRLNRLIEDILNTSRIESGLIKVDKKPVSLAILIEEQLQMIKSYAEEKNIEVITQKPIVCYC